MIGPRSRQHERAFSHKIEKGVNGLRVSAQMPARFTQHDLGGVQRAVSPGENRNAPVVPLVGGIEPADQRAGVNDGSYFHTLRGPKDHGRP